MTRLQELLNQKDWFKLFPSLQKLILDLKFPYLDPEVIV